MRAGNTAGKIPLTVMLNAKFEATRAVLNFLIVFLHLKLLIRLFFNTSLNVRHIRSWLPKSTSNVFLINTSISIIFQFLLI